MRPRYDTVWKVYANAPVAPNVSKAFQLQAGGQIAEAEIADDGEHSRR